MLKVFVYAARAKKGFFEKANIQKEFLSFGFSGKMSSNNNNNNNNELLEYSTVVVDWTGDSQTIRDAIWDHVEYLPVRFRLLTPTKTTFHQINIPQELITFMVGMSVVGPILEHAYPNNFTLSYTHY